MSRQCWTCNTEHDLDAPCKQSDQARVQRAASGSNSPLFGNAQAEPVDQSAFEAKYDGSCPACDEAIFAGEMIIGTSVGYIHEECAE